MRRRASASPSHPIRRRATGLGRLFGGALIAAALALVLLPALASAAQAQHHFKEFFGSAAQPTFANQAAMAVDPVSGDLLVADIGNRTLSRWKPNGEPDNFSALTSTNVIDGHAGEPDEVPTANEILHTEGLTPLEAEVAIAPPGSGSTAGDIYVTSPMTDQVDVFLPSGAYVTSIGGGNVVFPCGVAVGSAGEVFVGDYETLGIHKFVPAGPSYTEEAEFPFISNEFPSGTPPCQVAAGAGPSAGSFFGAAYQGTVFKFDSSGNEEYVVKAGVSGLLSVDPATGYLYETDFFGLRDFDVSGASVIELSDTPIAGNTYGVAVNSSTGDVYVGVGFHGPIQVFDPLPTLTVFKGGNGAGTVTSLSPVGINCGATCSVQLTEEDETFELEAAAEPGSVFAGWIGCRQLTATTCKVTAKEQESEVTAVFLQEGPAGQDGEGVTVNPYTGPECPHGGLEVTSPSGVEYVCNGSNGASGSNGTNGANGTSGKDGAAGPSGPQGAQGPKGDPGPAGKVTCKVTGKKVKCTVKATSKRAQRRQHLRWRLMRGGHAVSHGATSVPRLQRVLNHLRRGRYALHVQGQSGSTVIAVG